MNVCILFRKHRHSLIIYTHDAHFRSLCSSMMNETMIVGRVDSRTHDLEQEKKRDWRVYRGALVPAVLGRAQSMSEV